MTFLFKTAVRCRLLDRNFKKSEARRIVRKANFSLTLGIKLNSTKGQYIAVPAYGYRDLRVVVCATSLVRETDSNFKRPLMRYENDWRGSA